LRKFSAILLFIVFIWSQYAKQAAYLKCRISNSFNSFASKCDCGEKAGFDKPDPAAFPLSKTHTHIHPDELFPFTKTSQPDFSIAAFLTENPVQTNDCVSEGAYSKPFHPPRA
jgi:hypothetical protein